MVKRGKVADGRQKSAGGDDSGAPVTDRRADRLRIRAAWMYFIEQMTQNEIADVLGVGRITVVRMLAEARKS